MTRYLITSAIPYVNGVKHLGNLVGSLLPADVHATVPPSNRCRSPVYLRHRRAWHPNRAQRGSSRPGCTHLL